MDFLTYLERIKSTQCPRWSSRQRRLDGYRRALRGKLYAHLKHGFSEEKTNGWSGDRILLDNRRAAVEEGLANELVRDLLGMLFGESHRPTFTARKPHGKQKPAGSNAGAAGSPEQPGAQPGRSTGTQTKSETDQDTSDWIAAFIHDTGLWLLAIKMLWEGSVGACAVVVRVLGEEEEGAEGGFVAKGSGAYHFEVWPAHQCKPVFHRTAPTELESIERVWFVNEDALEAYDYNLEELEAKAKLLTPGMRRPRGSSLAAVQRAVNTEWVLRVKIDGESETWYEPVPRWRYERGDWNDKLWVQDAKRTEEHGQGETPVRWVRPLPLDDDDLFPDGMCLFEPVINHEFRIDRTLSQVGRAFDYSGDPQMARIFEQLTSGGGAFGNTFDEDLATGGTASDMLEQTGGDIKFVEITAEGLKVAIETYVKVLKDSAREAGAMSRVTPDVNTQALSSVAMKILNYALTALCDVLRITCVENEGLVPIIRLAMRMWHKVDVALPSLQGDISPDPAATISTSWPEYYELHGQDKLYEVQATTAAIEGGVLSRETAAEYIGGQFDVQDAGAEFTRIEEEQAAQAAEETNTTQSANDHALTLEKAKGENAVAVAKARGSAKPASNGARSAA